MKEPSTATKRAEDPQSTLDDILSGSVPANTDSAELDGVQNETGDRILQSVGDVVYSDRKGLKTYRILRAPAEKMQEWKSAIDQIHTKIVARDVEGVINLMNKEGHSKFNVPALRTLLTEEKFDDTDMILLAIGLFALREKAPWDEIRSRLKLYRGGDQKMESIFDQNGYSNCYDINVFVQEMAKEYGIEGTIIGRGVRHSYFRTTDGKVSDTLIGYRRGGLFQTELSHQRFLEEKRKSESLRSRVRKQIRTAIGRG